MSEAILQCQNLGKVYAEGSLRTEVLSGVNLRVAAGERVAIVGASGSGKSTLLHLLGGLDQASSGSASLLGQTWATLGDSARSRLRNRGLGFVYQFHHLLPELTAEENVALPLLIQGLRTAPARQRAAALLAEVGLSARLAHKPTELSGGERQRVALARALVHRPACVLADEPTGNLDARTAAQVFALMLELNQQVGTSLVVVTHDLHLAQQMQTCYVLEEGQLQLYPREIHA